MSELTLDSLLSSLSDSPAETQIEKAASEQVSVADELKNTLTKEASASKPTGENDMSQETGNAIAASVMAMLEKSAENKVVSDLNTMVAQHDARIEQTPRQGKTITETAKAMMQRDGGVKKDEIDGAQAAPEGNEGSNVPAKASDIEKAAAVNELMGEGYAFEDAIEMVKQASEELEAEESDLEKAAAVQELMGEGYAFDDAVELVKQASEELEAEESDLEKAAAVNELMGEGIAFEDAVELVKQASAEMYGEEYTDMEKAAAVQELMEEDGLSFDEASNLVKEAAAPKGADGRIGVDKPSMSSDALKAKMKAGEKISGAKQAARKGVVMTKRKMGRKGRLAGKVGLGLAAAGAAGAAAKKGYNKYKD